MSATTTTPMAAVTTSAGPRRTGGLTALLLLASALLTGLVSAVWHAPLALLGYTTAGNLAVGLAVWAAWLMCQEVIMSWLMARTGSVWAPSLAHAGNNLILVPLVAALLPGPGRLDDLSQVLTVLVLAAIAAVALLRATGHRKPFPESAGGQVHDRAEN